MARPVIVRVAARSTIVPLPLYDGIYYTLLNGGTWPELRYYVDGVDSSVLFGGDLDNSTRQMNLYYSATTGLLYILAYGYINNNTAKGVTIYSLVPGATTATREAEYNHPDLSEADYVTMALERSGALYLLHGGTRGWIFTAQFNLATKEVAVGGKIADMDMMNNSIAYYPKTGKWYLTHPEALYESDDGLTWANPRTMQTPGVVTPYPNDDYHSALGLNPFDGNLYFASWNQTLPRTKVPMSEVFCTIWRVESDDTITQSYTQSWPAWHALNDAHTADPAGYSTVFSLMWNYATVSTDATGRPTGFYMVTWSWESSEPTYVYKWATGDNWTQDTLLVGYESNGASPFAAMTTGLVLGLYNKGTANNLDLAQRDFEGNWAILQSTEGQPFWSYQSTVGFAGVPVEA